MSQKRKSSMRASNTIKHHYKNPRTKKKASAEKKRASAEKKKPSAAKKKASAEKKRASAEKKRASAEKKRASAEKKKASAEKKKASAAKKKASGVKKKASAAKKKASGVKKKASGAKIITKKKKQYVMSGLQSRQCENDAECNILKKHFELIDEHLTSIEKHSKEIKDIDNNSAQVATVTLGKIKEKSKKIHTSLELLTYSEIKSNFKLVRHCVAQLNDYIVTLYEIISKNKQRGNLTKMVGKITYWVKNISYAIYKYKYELCVILLASATGTTLYNYPVIDSYIKANLTSMTNEINMASGITDLAHRFFISFGWPTNLIGSLLCTISLPLISILVCFMCIVTTFYMSKSFILDNPIFKFVFNGLPKKSQKTIADNITKLGKDNINNQMQAAKEKGAKQYFMSLCDCGFFTSILGMALYHHSWFASIFRIAETACETVRIVGNVTSKATDGFARATNLVENIFSGRYDLGTSSSKLEPLVKIFKQLTENTYLLTPLIITTPLIMLMVKAMPVDEDIDIFDKDYQKSKLNHTCDEDDIDTGITYLLLDYER